MNDDKEKLELLSHEVIKQRGGSLHETVRLLARSITTGAMDYWSGTKRQKSEIHAMSELIRDYGHAVSMRPPPPLIEQCRSDIGDFEREVGLLLELFADELERAANEAVEAAEPDFPID